MKKLTTVSICMPAYNEQHNIDNILKQIYSQKQVGFVIENVVVVSDGSTDDTVKIAQRYKDHGVKIIDGKTNMGQTYRQNEILSFTSSDILVLLNADLLLGDDEVVSRLVTPILSGADLSAQWALPFKPHTLIQRILCAGFQLKYFIYKRHRNGDNIYTCVGHMRALSRKFYTNVKFPDVSDGEDQYLYLACVKNGYRYKYVPAHNLYFNLPETFNDYKKYAIRIFQTQRKFGDVYSKEMVQAERALPLSLKVHGCVYALLKHHLYAFAYIILHALMHLLALVKPLNSSAKFEPSTSTKAFSVNDL